MLEAQLTVRRTPLRLTALASAIATALATVAGVSLAADKLISRAVLPAATFAPGPTSGTQIGMGPINGQPVPFENQQPVQGFSAILDNGNGTFLVMSDNGFGSLENSADYHLRVYTIRPAFQPRRSTGTIAVEGFIELSDPDGHIPFAITYHFTEERILTGADFDIESFQKAPDGSLWFGDEFGPFLLHTDARGKLLEAPIPLPDFDHPGQDIRSPQNPFNEEGNPVRIMNAVRTHARIHGNGQTPVFSPWNEMLRFTGSDPDAFGRGSGTPPGLPPAPADVFDTLSVKQAGYPIVTWTVNDTPRMQQLMALKGNVNGQQVYLIDGIISDRPDLLLEVVRNFDADGDGLGGDYLTPEGLIDITRFDAQGHRGGRNLRPENTLPAMEAALDYLMTTLETDTGVSQDRHSMLAHDPYVEPSKCRCAAESVAPICDRYGYGETPPASTEAPALIKDLTVAEIQQTFVCDRNPGRGDSQKNDLALSPVTVAFAGGRGLPHPYVMPTVEQLFEFVDFYRDFYAPGGPGRNLTTTEEADRRWKNAQAVRFNIETKRNPRTDTDPYGNRFIDRTVDADTFADTLAGFITARNLTGRADIQSFDFSTLLRVQERVPAIRTVYLFGDFPREAGDDGTNLQDDGGANTPWLAGLYWPYRETRDSNSVRAQRSGGFEGMALSADGTRLLPLLEGPLVGADPKTLLIHEFDLATRSYTGTRYPYVLEDRGSNIGDFILFDASHGLVIERDGSQGNLNGFKAIYEITLGNPGAPVAKKLAVDLLNILDPYRVSLPGQAGDVGLGRRFAFPFVTIEDVVVIDRAQRLIGVLNDNNYPFSVGRHVGSGLPDDNEFITIQLDQPLGN